MQDFGKSGQRIVIYGAGPIGRIAIMVLRGVLDGFDARVVGCTVSDIEGVPHELEGLPVRELGEYAKMKENFLYLIAVKEIYQAPIKQNLLRYGIQNFKVFDYRKFLPQIEKKWETADKDRHDVFVSNMDKSMLTEEEYVLFLSKQIRTGELSFEVNLADHCNLNCQCCNHFSPLADATFLDCKQWEKDLKRLTELVPRPVGFVSLLGGEPLLHPKINEVMQVTRKWLPHTQINLSTNGLLLPKMEREFWEVVRELGVSIIATKYPINFDYDNCNKIAGKYGIRISYGVLPEPIKTTYLMPISDIPKFNPYQMYMKCAHANYCNVLREGRLYNCSFTANVHYYNKYFDKHIPEKNEVSIDIYKAKNWEEIEDFLKRPNHMCKHCDICHYEYHIPWATSKKNVKEWTGGI